jgi:hypothetical protein
VVQIHSPRPVHLQKNVESDLTSYGPINGGVFFYGHVGNLGGVMVVAVGQNSGPDTNISPTNVGNLSNFNSNLGPQVKITLYGCNAGYALNNQPSIAQQIANSVKREVLAYQDGVFFSQNPNEQAKDGEGLQNPPDSLPMYPIVAGGSPKPQLTPFFPQ